MSVATDLSVHGYNIVRKTAKDAAKTDAFPSHHMVREAKQKCYSPTSETTIPETGASVALQALLNHTVERLY